MSPKPSPIPLKATTLRLANAAQALKTRQNTFHFWGGGGKGGVSEEEWLTAFDILQRQEWGVNGAMAVWVLVPRGDPETIDGILSHCETLRRDAYYAPAGSSLPQKVVSYGITLVRTPTGMEGNKYAKHMVSLLHYKLAPQGQLPAWPEKEWGPIVDDEQGFQNARFSVLYSGIGLKYYAACTQGLGETSRSGWIPSLPVKRILPATKSLTPTLDEAGWKWLDYTGVRVLEESLRYDLEARFKGWGDTSRARVAISPANGVLAQLCMKDAMSLRASSHSTPRTYGLILPAEEGQQPACIVYSFRTTPQQQASLFINYVRHPVPWDVVVRAAQKEECDSVEVWGEAGELWAKEQPEEVEVGVPSNLPSLAVYSFEGECGTEDTDWLFNERYGSC